MDITPMIDIVFLLLIFFLVCSTMGKNELVRLPPARHGVGVNPAGAVVLTLAGSGGDSTVFLGDNQLPDNPQRQEEEIRHAVEEGRKQGKTDVVIRADKSLHHGEVVRIESIATSVPGMDLYVVVDDD